MLLHGTVAIHPPLRASAPPRAVECLSARLEVIIRSHMRLPLEGHIGEIFNKFRRDKASGTLVAPITPPPPPAALDVR